MNLILENLASWGKLIDKSAYLKITKNTLLECTTYEPTTILQK